MSKVLWLGFSVPDCVAKAVFREDSLPAIQTHKFGWSFARVLNIAFDEVVIVSSVPVRNFPLVRKVFFRGGRFETNGIKGRMIGFVNFVIVKHIARLLGGILCSAPLIVRNRVDFIFVHGVHTPYLILCWMATFFHVKTVAVLTDPPGVVLNTDGAFSRFMKRVDRLIVKWLLGRSFAVVSLSLELAHRLAPNVPALIIPGIVESSLDVIVEDPYDDSIGKSKDSFVVVYAGGLSKAYGVQLLVDAVVSLDESFEIRLELYGRGEEEERVKEIAKSNPRVFYGGFVESSVLIPILRSADLLINPRPTHQFFVSNSFPSKLVEYLAVGRPVLTTRIPTIPVEIESAFFYIDDESVIGIRDAIVKTINTPRAARLYHAENAALLVRRFFSEQAVAKRLETFLASIGSVNRGTF